MRVANGRRARAFAALAIVLAIALQWEWNGAAAQPGGLQEGIDMKKLRRTPKYPADKDCSPLTSLYSSWADVDGAKRSEPHSGVDGGRLGDPILAPAAGVVVAVWRANWGWGGEGALLIAHSRTDVGLTDGPEHYYSEFDHLRYEDISSIAVGKKITRGDRLASVFRPGGKAEYLPEVHWEVWSIGDDTATRWAVNKFGGRYWRNTTGRLVDPLYMLSLNAPAREDSIVEIPVFEPGRDYRGFRGFTYILPCDEMTGEGAGSTGGSPR
jgi:murein DD-endopeptidase MepM/ murein hydrolase activator NlpD